MSRTSCRLQSWTISACNRDREIALAQLFYQCGWRQVIPPELIGRIAPTRLEGINLRGVFRFPIERYADQLLPSQSASKTSAAG